MSAPAKKLLQKIMKKKLQTKNAIELASFPELIIITTDKKLPAFSDVFPPQSQALQDLLEFELQEITREHYKLDPKLSLRIRLPHNMI
jgi:hypothetical protein